LRSIDVIYISEGFMYLNVTEMSIEEISTRILQATGLKRRIG
ncbi:MAG: phosphoenolpyruvate synthase regulatory protein, partial [Acinetobacter sp.]